MKLRLKSLDKSVYSVQKRYIVTHDDHHVDIVLKPHASEESHKTPTT